MASKNVYCYVCDKVIPKERVLFLRQNNTPEHEMTTVDCSTTKKKKGLYMGENGTSELKLVDKLYNDSVRDVFRRSASEPEDEDLEIISDPNVDDVISKVKEIEDEV